jgi:hypothetical protein
MVTNICFRNILPPKSIYMKQIFFCILLLAMAGTSLCQQIKSSKQLTCEEYLTKSENQLNTARALLIGGGVLVIFPIIIAIPGTVSFDALEVLSVVVGVGVGASLASIPLFIASKRNRKKSLDPSLCVKIEKAAYIQQAGLTNHTFPALSFRINL